MNGRTSPSLCRFNRTGTCTKGINCQYEHKTCTFQTSPGGCRRANCPYGHSARGAEESKGDNGSPTNRPVPPSAPNGGAAPVMPDADAVVAEHRRVMDRERAAIQNGPKKATVGSIEELHRLVEERDARLALLNNLESQLATFNKAMGCIEKAPIAPTLKAEKQRREINRLSTRFPFYSFRDSILDTVARSRVSIIVGETGSGKSTQMAQYIADSELLSPGKKVVITQPRKVAAESLAQHVAEEWGCDVGQVIGYEVGGSSKTSRNTQVVFCTDQVLLNEIKKDGGLDKYEYVVVDEVHERSINTDLLLGILKGALKNGASFKVILTSATLSEELFYGFFSEFDPPIMKIPGRTFPVVDHWQPAEEDYTEAAARKAVEVHRAQKDKKGDILVFLSAQDEIDRAINIATRAFVEDARSVLLLPLHGKLQPEERNRVFAPAPQGRRKIIFSTNVAETSVTIDGVVYVIDSGMAKINRFDSRRNMAVLAVDYITQSSVKQRRGRAGRTQPGVCYHLYSEDDFNKMEESQVAEILRSNLALALLKLKDMGVGSVRGFELIEKPSDDALDQAMDQLTLLGALQPVNGGGEVLTEVGQRMARLGLEPMLARVVLAAEALGVMDEAIIFAGMVAAGGNIFWRGGSDADRNMADIKKAALCGQYSDDSLVAVTVFRKWLAVPQAERANWCRENCIFSKVLRSAYQTSLELRAQLRREGCRGVPDHDTSGQPVNEDTAQRLRRAICAGYFVNSCVYNGTPQAGYTVAKLDQPVLVHPGSVVATTGIMSPWIIYTELAKTSRLFVRLLTQVELDWIIEASPAFDQRVHLGRLADRTATCGDWVTVGSGLVGSIIGRQGATLSKLEADLVCTVEFDHAIAACRLWSQPSQLKTAQSGFQAFLHAKRQELAEETSEFVVTGSTRVVVGGGGLAQKILLKGEYLKIILRGLPVDFQWDDNAKALFSAHAGSPVRSIQSLGKASDDSTSWGLLEFGDIEPAKQFVDALDGSIFEQFGPKRISARPSMQAGALSDGGLLLNLRETAIKVVWYCGRPKNNVAYAVFDTKDNAWNAAQALKNNPVVVQGQPLFSKISNGDPLSIQFNAMAKGAALPAGFDDILLLQALESMELPGLIRVNAPREKVGASEGSTEFDVASFISLWTSIGQVEDCLTFPPLDEKKSKGKAYIRFQNAIDAITAVERYNGQVGVFGDGTLHVQPDFSWTVNLSRQVYDVMAGSIEEAKQQLKAEFGYRIKISEVKKQAKGVTLKVESLVPLILTAAKRVFGPVLAGTLIRDLEPGQRAALMDRSAWATVDKIIKDTGCFISLERRTKQIRLYHRREDVKEQAKRQLLTYATRAAQLVTESITLPAGGLPALVREDGKGLAEIEDATGADVTVNFRSRCVQAKGTPNAVENAVNLINEKLAPFRASSKVHANGAEQECGICLCPMEAREKTYQVISCGHIFHYECTQSQIRSAVQGKGSSLPIQCAACSENLTLRDISSLTTPDELEEICKSAYSKLVDEAPDAYRWCPSADCRQVASLADVRANRGLFQCPDCLERYCMVCKDKDGDVVGVKYHDGMSCAEYEASKDCDAAFLAWTKEWIASNDVKVCPKCNMQNERIPGTCNKFHCAYCHIYFCWKCLGFTANNEKAVYAHLNTAHGGCFDF